MATNSKYDNTSTLPNQINYKESLLKRKEIRCQQFYYQSRKRLNLLHKLSNGEEPVIFELLGCGSELCNVQLDLPNFYIHGNSKASKNSQIPQDQSSSSNLCKSENFAQSDNESKQIEATKMSLWPGTDHGKPVAEDGESAQFVTGYSESKGKLLEEQIKQQEALIKQLHGMVNISQTEANTSIGRTALPRYSTASHRSGKINLQSPDRTTPGQKVHENRTSRTMNSEQQGDSAVGKRLLMEVEMTAKTATNEHGNMLPDRSSTDKERIKQMAEEVILNRLKKIKSNVID